MKINIEILKSAYLLGKKDIENLHTKELVPNMMLRRRLSRNAKLAIELSALVDFKKGRIIYGSSYGELSVTAKIVENIKDSEPISPTDFQNSVYNTAVSYLSILNKNKSEIMTLSSGDNTSKAMLKMGAIKALDNDDILLLCIESMDIPRIEEINRCVDYLECAVALKIRITKDKANIKVEKSKTLNVPSSISELLNVVQKCENITNPILEVEI